MNTEEKDDKAAATPADRTATAPRAKTDAARKSPGAMRTLLRLLLLVIVLGGIAAAGWFGWHWLNDEKARYDATLARQAERITRLEAQAARLSETQVARDEFDELGKGLANAQASLGERMNTIASDMEALREAAQGGRRDLIKAEVEYLLRIAADELYLTQDVDTALYALQAADDRLRQLADPRFNPVRQLIADHLQALGAVSVPDVSGMALKLGSLMNQVAELPLRQARHAREVEETIAETPPDMSWWDRARAGIARVFSKLVVVQSAEPPPPLLSPDEHFFLYRNVELQLAAARTALLAGDAAAYRQSLETAREWLGRYFDANDPAVANMIADLSGLLDVALQPAVPDITGALDRFRTLNGNTVRPTTGARTE